MSETPAPPLTNADRAVLDLLAQEGDAADIPRPVRHFLYLPTRAAAEEAVAWAAREGFLSYRMDAPGDPVVGDSMWCVVLDREQAVEPRVVASVTASLEEAARLWGGEYDGWESPAVRSVEDAAAAAADAGETHPFPRE